MKNTDDRFRHKAMVDHALEIEGAYTLKILGFKALEDLIYIENNAMIV